MSQKLNAILNRQAVRLGVSRRSSAAKGNMGALPPMSLYALNLVSDD